MPAKITSAVRYLFVSTLITSAIVAGLQAAAAGHERIGVRSCGWEGNPCELAPLVVTAGSSAADAAQVVIAKR